MAILWARGNNLRSKSQLIDDGTLEKERVYVLKGIVELLNQSWNRLPPMFSLSEQ